MFVRSFVRSFVRLLPTLLEIGSLVLIFGTKVQNGNTQKVTEHDFQKKNFPAENAGNMPEKPVFKAFSRDFIISFF